MKGDGGVTGGWEGGVNGGGDDGVSGERMVE